MRDEERNPVPRGTTLVAEGDTGPAGTAQPPANASPATDKDHDPAGVRGRSDGPGAARADGVPEASPAAPAASKAGPAGAGKAAEPAEDAAATAPGEGSQATGSGADTDGNLSGRVVGATPGDAVAGRGPNPGVVDVPRRPPAAPAPEPSWGKVLATTISLWTGRRLRRLSGGGRGRGQGIAAVPGARPRRSGFRWPLVAFVLVLVALALSGLQLSGVLSHGQGQAATGPNGGTRGSNGALSAAEAARADAASWVTQQVTASAVIACDALMCSALQADGVAASRLMTVQATTPDPLGADVVMATASVRSQFCRSLVSEYAPQLLARFGSGASRVDVRAVAPDGAAAFARAEQADLAQRRAAGAQLIRNDSLIGARDAAAIRAGQVDSRLLITLASLLSQRPVDVGSFAVSGPGAPVLYRQVTIVDAPGQAGPAALQADLSQVRTQPSSYRPAHAEIVQLANGQSALRIDFGAPDPPGLLAGGGNS